MVTSGKQLTLLRLPLLKCTSDYDNAESIHDLVGEAEMACMLARQAQQLQEILLLPLLQAPSCWLNTPVARCTCTCKNH